MRRRLSSVARRALYEAETAKARELGFGDLPICNICRSPIRPPGLWHVSHNPLLPAALNGLIDGIAHAKCNIDHARNFDVPLITKVKRIAEKHRDIHRPVIALPGGREDPRKRKMNGRVVSRENGELWRDWPAER